MAIKRITMQDIADACGLSRNTVSKIFNGRGAVPEATRRMVLERARELGYRHDIKEVPAEKQETPKQSIALFTSQMPTDYHFGTFFVPAFAEQLSRAGYTLTMYQLSPEEIRDCILPEHVSIEQTAGVLGIELFSKNYVEMLCGLGLPTIFIDTYSGSYASLPKYDLVSMENIAAAVALTQHVIGAGAKTIGFVGDSSHCNSFYERWLGFCSALLEAGIALDRNVCILEGDGPLYSDTAWLAARLKAMQPLPDALVCANDFIAIHVMVALKQLGISIPDRVMVTGFDGLPQSAVLEPSLTTAQIPSAEIGRVAAENLLKRIENPDRPFCCTYVKTTPVWRNSTAKYQKR